MKRRSFFAALPGLFGLAWLWPKKAAKDYVVGHICDKRCPTFAEKSKIGDAVLRMRASLTEEQMRQIQRAYDSMTASFKAEAARRYYRDGLL